MRLVILGGTGSGKGTQVDKLCENFGCFGVSTSEILRSNISDSSDLGVQAKSYVEKGDLVPDQLMIQLIKKRLQKINTDQSWILEGYPRTAFQAEELDFLLKELKQTLNFAIYLKVSEATMKQRSLTRGLNDDTSEVIDQRIQNFQQFTIPILDYYQYSDRLITIDGEQTLAEVEQEIANHLKPLSSKSQYFSAE